MPHAELIWPTGMAGSLFRGPAAGHPKPVLAIGSIRMEPLWLHWMGSVTPYLKIIRASFT